MSHYEMVEELKFLREALDEAYVRIAALRCRAVVIGEYGEERDRCVLPRRHDGACTDSPVDL